MYDEQRKQEVERKFEDLQFCKFSDLELMEGSEISITVACTLWEMESIKNP